MSGRFPLLTDENVPGPLVEALHSSGWDVAKVIDAFGQRSVDNLIFAYAVEHGRVLVTTDTDCLSIAKRWLEEGRSFRLVYWHQGRHQRVPPAQLVRALEMLSAKGDAFASCIEYLKVEA